MSQGKIITIEGIDGSGKNTQSSLLVKNLRIGGYGCEKFDFPRYHTPIGKELRDYLDNKTPSKLSFEELCRLFARNRLEAKPEIEFWINFHGTIVINNRYFESNLAYQGAKYFEKRKEIWDFLYNLEIKEMCIRESDLVYLLDIPAQYSRDAMKEQGRELDINESDIKYQEKVRECYLELAQMYGWNVIDCLRGDSQRKTQQELSQELYNKVLADLKGNNKVLADKYL